MVWLAPLAAIVRVIVGGVLNAGSHDLLTTFRLGAAW
jgi:hypothetical protein